MQNLPDKNQLLRLLQSNEGREFLAMLQSADPAALNAAADKAKKGEMEAAKTALSAVLDTPEGRALLVALGGNYGGTGR